MTTSFLQACQARGVERWSAVLWAMFLDHLRSPELTPGYEHVTDANREWQPDELPSWSTCLLTIGLQEALEDAVPRLQALTRAA